MLGLDPVPGGDQPLIYAATGPVALTILAAGRRPRRQTLCPTGGEGRVRGRTAIAAIAPASLRKDYNDAWESEPRIPAGNPAAGEWTAGGGDGSFEVAASGNIPCQGGWCQTGGSHGKAAMYRIFNNSLCRDCAVKEMGLEDEPGAEQTRVLAPYLIGGE